MATTVTEATLKTLEDEIYGAYYKLNPKGDARYNLWPAVIKAKKEKDPVKALKAILKEVEEGIF